MEHVRAVSKCKLGCTHLCMLAARHWRRPHVVLHLGRSGAQAPGAPYDRVVIELLHTSAPRCFRTWRFQNWIRVDTRVWICLDTSAMGRVSSTSLRQQTRKIFCCHIGPLAFSCRHRTIVPDHHSKTSKFRDFNIYTIYHLLHQRMVVAMLRHCCQPQAAAILTVQYRTGFLKNL